jgi:putative alpha-1,2-mannosidase
MGGDEAVRGRLDEFFSFAGAAAAPVVVPKAQNQATLFGIAYYGNQYAPGNEHDLQAPFLYNYVGAPW